MNKYTKDLICAYCECNATANNGKCEACELNPAFAINFQLGRAAKVAIEKGVMTESGAMAMVLEANKDRYALFEALFAEDNDEQRDPTV